MGVCVDEARHQRVTLEIDKLGAVIDACIFHVTAQPRDSVALNTDESCARVVHGDDWSPIKDVVHFFFFVWSCLPCHGLFQWFTNKIDHVRLRKMNPFSPFVLLLYFKACLLY